MNGLPTMLTSDVVVPNPASARLYTKPWFPGTTEFTTI